MRTKPIRPLAMTVAQRNRALAFHEKKLNTALEEYSKAVFAAWVLINSTLDLKANVMVHMQELCRITKNKPK